MQHCPPTPPHRLAGILEKDTTSSTSMIQCTTTMIDLMQMNLRPMMTA